MLSFWEAWPKKKKRFILKNKYTNIPYDFFLRTTEVGYYPTLVNMHYKAIVIKLALNWHRNEHACQWNRRESIEPYLTLIRIYFKIKIVSQMGKDRRDYITWFLMN